MDRKETKLDKWKKNIDTYYQNISKEDLKKDLEKAGFKNEGKKYYMSKF